MTNREDVRKRVWEIAEECNTTPFELRKMVIRDYYDIGCMDHEEYVLIMGWIEAQERIHAADCEIVELEEFFKTRMRAS